MSVSEIAAGMCAGFVFLMRSKETVKVCETFLGEDLFQH
jgi:hypothetical protein